MLSNKIEEIKYKDSHGREVIPLWRLQGLLKHAEKEILNIIINYQNPYPKDIFLWDNTGKIDFSRGRFNKHCYTIVESMRSNLLKDIEENQGE